MFNCCTKGLGECDKQQKQTHRYTRHTLKAATSAVQPVNNGNGRNFAGNLPQPYPLFAGCGWLNAAALKRLVKWRKAKTETLHPAESCMRWCRAGKVVYEFSKLFPLLMCIGTHTHTHKHFWKGMETTNAFGGQTAATKHKTTKRTKALTKASSIFLRAEAGWRLLFLFSHPPFGSSLNDHVTRAWRWQWQKKKTNCNERV